MKAHAYNVVGAILIGSAILMIGAVAYFARRYPASFAAGKLTSAFAVPLAMAAVSAGVYCLISAFLSGIGRP